MRRTLAVTGLALGTVVAVAATSGAQAVGAQPDGIQGSGRARAAQGREVVIDWNRALLEIVRTPGAQPATVHPTRSFAILHTAIAGGVAATGRGASGSGAGSGAGSASGEAAAAQAGHDSLAALYPARRPDLDRRLADELAGIPDGPAKAAGIRAGQRAAAAVLADRAHDGSDATPPPYTPTGQPGDYRPTPPSFPAPVFTHWAAVRPFALGRADRFRPVPPPALTTRAYARGINEVQSLGQDTSTTRTPDQTTQARFWAAPIWNYWNEIAQNAARRHGIGLAATAALFAALDRTFADSVIAFYDGKYHFRVWRPITAIREADTDGNPDTHADPGWNPLATTPADPSYPGAHSVVAEAGAIVLGSFFGPDDTFTVGSESLPGVTRSFTSYQDAADEAGISRVYAGVHTRSDHVAGALLGVRVARFDLAHGATR
ncbi:vanadium-dependent haloperoxidase [Actinomadura decatromicini]|uniref:Vanadium-dependent haloperoxidase n=1 Tax=Actinomadura decatromicini TaxID=2604572 RepID=A0A5D3FTB4_9ACTN|nr:vanadium-dependent haloperoxidase [Actinomadura decatromicini]TYK51314.1 vanadium-dependent haloperoxidase [Actinomadura decatromicini]